MIRMELDVSFFLAIIVAAHLNVVQSHLCVLEKRPDPSRGGALRWSLPFAEICLCSLVVAPAAKACPRKDKDGDLWFVDDPHPFTMRHNWKKDILDDLLNRTTYCKCTLTTDNCDANAACTNIPVGSFTCACNAGYSGDGLTCADINECTVSTDNCDANATCTNTAGSFTCACSVGYIGDGITCTDVDECALSPGNCDANATCTNTAGSFTCACNDGYSGDGVTCTDFNECTSSTDNCDAKATCTNTVGSFTCACNAGYSGDGLTCTVCMDYLGMRNGDIPDENINASSAVNSEYEATNGRLNGSSSWHSALFPTGITYIQADIGYQTYVTGVITQGDGQTAGADYVTSFKVSTFLTTGANEVFVKDQNGIAIIFPGHVDQYAEVTTSFSEPVYARIVRINCLTKFTDYYALRFEILGCKND
ncbi:uncharacterized protein [Amphiura filiformis]|uniref:uncharacterized protein n=1 Tax=Amphiura filiformis TaxID=82378 RepID=UPI003B221C4A